MDPDRVARVCPECGWLPDRSAGEIWKKGARNGRGRWRWISAMVVGFVAAVFVGQGVWRGGTSTSSMTPRPWHDMGSMVLVRFSVDGDGRAGTDLPIVMGDEFIAIAEGRASGEQLLDLLPSAEEMAAEFPGGAVLMAAYGDTGLSESSKRTWGWPLPWCRDITNSGYDDFRKRENERTQAQPKLRKPQWINTRIMYDLPTDRFSRTVYWDFAGPAATILLVVVAYGLIVLVFKLFERKHVGDRFRKGRRIAFWSVVFVVLLLNVLSFGKTDTSWSVSAYSRPPENKYSLNPLITVPHDETVALAQGGSNPGEIARAVLEHSDWPPQDGQVVHLLLAHPFEIERESTSFGMPGPLSFFGSSKSHLVRILSNGTAEPLGAPRQKWYSFYEAWTSLSVNLPGTGDRDQSIHIRVANLILVVFLLWLIWRAAIGTGWLLVRFRTNRRTKRRQCTQCGYSIGQI